jgi:hypothetical protein
VSRYETRIVWPPFKGKAHKVIDTTTGQGVGLYRTPTGAQRKAKALNDEAAAAARRERDAR